MSSRGIYVVTLTKELTFHQAIMATDAFEAVDLVKAMIPAMLNPGNAVVAMTETPWVAQDSREVISD